MKRNMVMFTGALALMICLSVQAFAKGLYWESTRTGREGKGDGVSKSYYMPRMCKIVMEDNKGAVIIRLDKEEMLMLNHKKKTYQEMTFNEMETMMKGVISQMQEVAKQMEKELAAMPAEQRKMVEQMMGKNLIKKQEEKTVVKTDETKNISNYACTKFILKEGDKDVATIWATKDIDDFKAMQQDMEEFGKRMATMMPGNLEGQMDRSIALVDGFPVRTEMTDGTTMTVTNAEKRSIPASEFEAPSGYKKEKLPAGMKGEK
ncbi:MAG: DUF4412 domain-containing protein [Candidatus Brocadiaceae bacterium]|nr:DUF4412 domain-containing protein [Candidatus Brocadiaceae bacterium]